MVTRVTTLKNILYSRKHSFRGKAYNVATDYPQLSLRMFEIHQINGATLSAGGFFAEDAFSSLFAGPTPAL